MRLARELDPDGLYDFNHVYSRSGETTHSIAADSVPLSTPIRVGLVDTGADPEHASFAAAQLVERGFHPNGYQPDRHGTQVASLMVGTPPATGQHTLLVADVYGASPTGGSAGAILAALSWMVENRVGVINVSLVGPDNRLLDVAIADLVGRGHLIVAAVGNDGPHAPPLYPAAYPGVVGVTGVDPSGRVLPEAGRGDHVDFAALGRDLRAADLGGGWVLVRGTSFAAPSVARRLATLHATPSRTDAQRALAQLASTSEDLGRPGRDRVYGHGRIDGAQAGVRNTSASAH